jgi:hypothetical protein
MYLPVESGNNRKNRIVILAEASIQSLNPVNQTLLYSEGILEAIGMCFLFRP